MWLLVRAVIVMSALLWAGGSRGEEIGGPIPLRVLSRAAISSIVPPGAHVMVEPATIEGFLAALDGVPPDWSAVYGHGHHDPGHDDRLFALNRERDAARSNREALAWPVTFSWAGELSPFNPELGGFPVALGPKFIRTRWGMVRFKPEEAPGNLVAAADGTLKAQIEGRLAAGTSLEIEVLMTGKLIPDESIVYDFSHDEEGLGLIMPFVRVERVDLMMVRGD